MTNLNMTEALEQVENLGGLNPKDKNCLRLLTEEMFSMTKSLLSKVETGFEIRISGKAYELCLKAKAEVDRDQRQEFVELSSKKENVAEKGMKGKILSVLEDFMYSSDMMPAYAYGIPGELHGYTAAWTMSSFVETAPREEQKDAWDGMEKSIIVNFADDVIIGARRNMVEMTVKKTFN